MGYSGNNKAQTTLNDIKAINVVNGSVSITSIDSVEQAIEDLDQEYGKDAEKWLVIFTGGKFDKTSRTVYGGSEFANILDSFLDGKTGIQVCYIPISDEAVNTYLGSISNASNIFQPSENSDIAKLWKPVRKAQVLYWKEGTYKEKVSENCRRETEWGIQVPLLRYLIKEFPSDRIVWVGGRTLPIWDVLWGYKRFCDIDIGRQIVPEEYGHELQLRDVAYVIAEDFLRNYRKTAELFISRGAD